MDCIKWGMLLAMIFILVGCSSTPRQYSKPVSVVKKSNQVDLRQSQQVKSLLISQYMQWKGTPYQYGGNSRYGVDCSGFVQRTYLNKFGYQIPRTTRTQVQTGYKVDKSQLKTGDIVFFKTGRNTFHNGIYLDKSNFLHASTSNGVTISNLENSYWQNAYWTSRRLE